MANKKITLESLKSRISLDLEIDVNYDCITFTFKSKKDHIRSFNIYRNNSDISCGVEQLYNLPLNERFTALTKYIKDKDKQSFYNDLFKYGFNKSKKLSGAGCAFFVLSNTTHKENGIINEVLDSICPSKSRVRVNPNSKNKIKVWIF